MRRASGGLGPGPGPRPWTRRKAKAQAPKLQPKALPGPKPGNAPDLHDARHASDILDSFAFDFPFPGLMSVAYRCLFCFVLVDQTNGKSPAACEAMKADRFRFHDVLFCTHPSRGIVYWYSDFAGRHEQFGVV